MEAESALEWDRTSGGRQSYPEDSFEAGKQFAEGNEHRIFQNDDGSRAIKLTRPPNYGARGALLEYLDNLVVCNYLAADDLRLEGVMETPEGPQLIISQPWVPEHVASLVQIAAFLTHHGFEPAGVHAWYSASEGIRIMDARPANIFVDPETGILIPIDIHFNVPPELLEEAWREQERRENLTSENS